MSNRALPLMIVSLILGSCLAARADDPVLVVHDYMRGMKITTTTDAWSFSPLGRFGVNMTHRPNLSALKLDDAFSQTIQPNEALAKAVEQAQANENLEILSESEEINVGGETAVGFSYMTIRDEQIFVYFWFTRGDRIYEGNIRAKKADFDTFRAEATKVLDEIEYLD